MPRKGTKLPARVKGDRLKKDEPKESPPALARIHDAPRPGWISLGNGARVRPMGNRDS